MGKVIRHKEPTQIVKERQCQHCEFDLGGYCCIEPEIIGDSCKDFEPESGDIK
jgi:hypothetical protein